MKAFDYDATDDLQKPIALDRFNASVKRAIELYSLKKENKEEEGEHIFIKSNLKKIKCIYIGQMSLMKKVESSVFVYEKSILLSNLS